MYIEFIWGTETRFQKTGEKIKEIGYLFTQKAGGK